MELSHQASAGVPHAVDGGVPTVSLAAAVVVHDGKVLAVRRSYREKFLPGAWGVPCGKLEPGERPEDGVLRELFEETRLHGEVVRGVGEQTFHSELLGRAVHNRQTNFLVRPLTFEVVLPEPDQEYEWVPAGRIDESGLDAHNRAAVHQALTAMT